MTRWTTSPHSRIREMTCAKQKDRLAAAFPQPERCKSAAGVDEEQEYKRVID